MKIKNDLNRRENENRGEFDMKNRGTRTNNSRIKWGILALLMSGVLMAQGNLGQAGANFLQIHPEPMGAALGGSAAATVTGANALFWNPGAAITENRMEAAFAHTEWFTEAALFYGAATFRFGNHQALGLSLISFTFPETEITTVYNPDGTGEFYNAGDLAAGISYMREMTDRFSFGVTAKFVHEYIWNETASEAGFDIGSLYKADFLNLRLGMAIRNIGGKTEFSGDDIDKRIAEEEALNQENNPRIERLTPGFRLPQTFQMGVAIDPVQSAAFRMTFSADVDVPSDNRERLTLATQLTFLEKVSLRAAWLNGYDTASLAFGGGIALPLGPMKTAINYSYSLHDYFNNVHRLGMVVAWK
jgi:hypothetical protein